MMENEIIPADNYGFYFTGGFLRPFFRQPKIKLKPLFIFSKCLHRKNIEDGIIEMKMLA
jgi:hypothetical protein